MDQSTNPFADIGDMETFYERVAPLNLGCGWRIEDRDPGSGGYSSPGASELPVRAQFKAWLGYMQDGMA